MRLLEGIRVIEFDGIGPAPFAGMLLADHGAEVIRIARPGGQPNGVDAGDADLLLRGRAATLALDLKDPAGRAAALDRVAGADALIEGFRPGVMERLGLGPADCLARRPSLVYGRITGWGQTGPWAERPGHDINYLALSGALHALGDPDRPPPPPLNMVADFGGGGMLLAFGIAAALARAARTGEGGVVDAAMLDGAALLLAMTVGWRNAGLGSERRGENILDGAAPFYRCYATADGQHLAVGALEPRFWAAARAALGLADPLFDAQHDRALWPEMRRRIADLVASRPLAGWQAAIDTPDACITPVLAASAAAGHPHVASRGTLAIGPGGLDVAPAPRWTPAGDVAR